ncbi:hypothetical protein [Brevifollis gellanilyticus]|uniref:Uncharacterized protein n=1 Tax=Brevifollis gellanilyticus TaxID=748831 RepID=A0A512MHD3_9BACT|nr:hypothetical protein [Brevifollis gellanilyticus]GEP46134.1 hypothetical protein BGE01nite_54250 [Brevifollis gellanilyticus]
MKTLPSLIIPILTLALSLGLSPSLCHADGMSWKLGTAERSGVYILMQSPCPTGLEPSHAKDRWITLHNAQHVELAHHTLTTGGSIPNAEKWPLLQPRLTENQEGSAFTVSWMLHHYREGEPPAQSAHWETFTLKDGKAQRIEMPLATTLLEEAFKSRHKEALPAKLTAAVTSIIPQKWITPDQLQVLIRGPLNADGKPAEGTCVIILQLGGNTMTLKSILEFALQSSPS